MNLSEKEENKIMIDIAELEGMMLNVQANFEKEEPFKAIAELEVKLRDMKEALKYNFKMLKKEYYATKDQLVALINQLDYPLVSQANLDGYVSAMINLYSFQNGLTLAKSDIRTDAVKQFLENHKKKEKKRRDLDAVDTQIGSIKDGYLPRQQQEMMAAFFFNKSFTFMKYVLAFTLRHFCLLRGDNFRELRLTEVFIIDMNFKHSQSMSLGPKALALVIRNSKTNKDAKPQIFS